MCVELAENSATMLKSMLLTNHRYVERITSRLIALTKVRPHLRDSTEAHKLRRKLRLNTLRENCGSLNILITHPSARSHTIKIDTKITE
jgi:hypothetical protein